MKFDEVSYELGRQASGGGGGSAVIESITITQNGTTTAPSGVDGYSPVIVAVPTPTYGTLNVSANGTYTPTAPTDAYNEVVVAVTPTLQNKSITVNGTYTADAGYDGLGEVVVNVSGGAQTYNFSGDIDYVFAPAGSTAWFGVNGENIGTFSNITTAQNAFYVSDIPYPENKTIPLDNANCTNMFNGYYNGALNKVCDNLTGTISSAKNMFMGSTFSEIDLSNITEFYQTGATATAEYNAFRQLNNCTEFTMPLKFNVVNCYMLFYGSYYLQHIYLPTGFVFSQMNVGTNLRNDNAFALCCSLLDAPMTLYNHIVDMAQSNNTASRLAYGGAFMDCYCVDKINGVHILSYDKTNTTLFSSMLYRTHMLDSFTFQSNQTADWNNQTLDISEQVGYFDAINYSDADYLPDNTKRITDQATYALYKNERYGWTSNPDYARYNHDSAVETINSLPTLDTANNKSCTIKFKGDAGALTDAGAINTLTASELAVATTKGWTVSLV